MAQNLFPTVWQLLLPNFTIWTVLGVLAMLLGIGLFYAGFKTKLLSGVTSNSIFKVGGGLIAVGFLLIWGISIIQDFVTSSGGFVVTLGTIGIVITYFMFYWKPNKKKRKEPLL